MILGAFLAAIIGGERAARKKIGEHKKQAEREQEETKRFKTR